MEFLGEFWMFLRDRKKYWLWPELCRYRGRNGAYTIGLEHMADNVQNLMQVVRSCFRRKLRPEPFYDLLTV